MLATIPDWFDRGACRDYPDPRIWFPERGVDCTSARKICESCKVQPQCLGYALRTKQEFGMWGGLSERQRRRLRKWRECRSCGVAFAYVNVKDTSRVLCPDCVNR
jgi:WhiB family redox-sensing transcriptional regulator